jgi:anthranilate synthase/aminodeoxychorismate synthase-like glutamine amidotransferase
MIVVIDHFDSFVETLARYVREAGHETRVMRQDTPLQDILALQADGLILSPGPGGPDTTGVTRDLLAHAPDDLPILGVCLGHQALADHFGAPIVRAKEPRHGKSSMISHNGHRMFKGLPSHFQAGRYHALIAENLPDTLEVTASSEIGEVMAFAHRTRPVYGLQFHPESVLTPQGRQMIDNFLTLANPRVGRQSA